MKRSLYVLCLLVMLTPAVIAFCNRYLVRRQIVILSTNDIHANIGNFARLASAVKECRDTAACILVDAGDRWTGNAFVDIAPEPRKPIIDLMNELGYSVATFGNHEFDGGREFLSDMMDECDFEIVCANIGSEDGMFPEVEPYTVVKVGGVKVGFAGVVTNYDHGHPDGNADSFEGLFFPDPQEAAMRAAEELKHKCDVPVLLSHMGYAMDIELAGKTTDYPLIISGHTHVLADTLVNATVIGQTRKNLIAVGATTIRLRGKRITDIDYRNVMLADYDPDPEFRIMVDEIMSDPYLHESVGYNAAELDKVGLADMLTTIIARATDSEVGFYHFGGIRLDRMAADSVSRATLFDLDPFFSTVYTMKMTPEQMRRMIIEKFNDTGNVKESHRIDLFSTAPYTIITDAAGEAVDVRFPTLRNGHIYKVAMCNYIAEKYNGIEADDITPHSDLKVLDAMIDYFDDESPVKFSNKPKQFISR
ncbi:MAG: bifunctional metallophosphatase/5'-nucleotidase [Alistipes sp.]|nr:bifunctional metallophosphatase/5'-nucleotidase [Alistipes sp.]